MYRFGRGWEGANRRVLGWGEKCANCHAAVLKVRVVARVRVGVRGERGAARGEKTERKSQRFEAGTRGWNADVLRHWQPSLRPWPGGEEDRGGRGDCAVSRKCAVGWSWLCAASVGPPGEKEGEGEIKTVVGLVSEAGTGRCCGTANLRAVLDGRGGWREEKSG